MSPPAKTALILAGGELTPSTALRALGRAADWVVAADSGLRHARSLRLVPNLLIGDFDSVTKRDLSAFPGLERQRFPVHKDALDLELALERALAAGAERLLVFGALGARLDQTLAALFIGVRYREAGHALSFHDGLRSAYPLAGEDRLELELAPAHLFSLLSLSDASTVSLTGARYPLERAQLEFGVGRGVSNRAEASPLLVELHAGRLLVIVEQGGL